jgi:site-specific recombinase XerC
MLFDWLVVGHLLDTNPAHAVRGPKHSIKKGKTPMLTAEEARTLLNSIPVTRMVKRRGSEEQELSYITGIRDRALIGLMVFTFARIGAAIGMKLRTISYRGGAAGSGCMKKAVSATMYPQITIWTSIWKRTSKGPVLRTTRRGHCFAPCLAKPIDFCAGQ